MLQLTESQRRLYDKLYCDLGHEIVAYLQDKDVNEIMLNPDGQLWIDTASTGQQCKGNLSLGQAYSIINAVAGIHGLVVSSLNPRLETRLPIYEAMNAERFSAQVPPIVASPTFNLRKRSEIVYQLEDYVNTGRASLQQAATLRELVQSRKNILVCGAPGSGKTTVTNALIREAVSADKNQRFILLEDTLELQCEAPNQVSLLATETVSMTDLLRIAMRMRPDRIMVGEVRGREAHDMLKAWNVGCPGGICTLHANGSEEAVQRILDLAMEAGLSHPPLSLVRHTLDAVVFVSRHQHQKGFIQEIVKVGDFSNDTFHFEKLA